MKIRRLKKEDRFDAYLISAYCFHSRIEDVESEREKKENITTENWGAFTDDGILMSRIVNNSFDFYIDGTAVKSGGIGGVSTLPEYRNMGGISAIFRELLPAAYRNGEVISTLYPFNHGFYRKQGYEVVTYKNEYEFAPELLECYRSDCDIKAWKPGDAVTEYLNVYNEFAKQYNFAMPRDEETMLKHIDVKSYYKDRKFTYLFSKDCISKAYVTFRDIYHDPSAILQVEETAWTDRCGFEAVLSFLGRFDADYGTVRLPLPCGIDLMRIIRTRRAYDIKKEACFDFMVRVINAERLLKVIRKPDDCDFTVGITDDIIKENTGIWHVTSNSVVRVNDVTCIPDLEVSERSFAQMATGSIGLEEAALKPDVKINSNEDMLRRVIAEKHIFINEHF